MNYIEEYLQESNYEETWTNPLDKDINFDDADTQESINQPIMCISSDNGNKSYI